MKIKKIDHIGIAVKNLDEALKLWRDDLGLELAEIEEVAGEKVKVAIFCVGESKIELLAPTASSTGVAQFLQKRGEGIHHFCLEVENLEESLKEMKARGFRLINEEPTIGAGGKKAAFLHPKSLHGVLLELSQHR
jgi:methylmalonyl-CoA/ethylmalonyl-CoA epimerase